MPRIMLQTPIGGETPRVPYGQLTALWAASRVALLLVGLLATSLLPSGVTAQPGNLRFHQPTALALEIWARWDSEWYLLIAAAGYDVGTYLEQFAVDYEPSAAAGFFPLYPLLVRFLEPVFGGVAAGVVLSNLCLLGALFLLYRLTAAEIGGEAGASAGRAACLAMLLYPMSLFLSAVYAESLFLLLVLAFYDRLLRRRLAAAGMLGALAALTRPLGVLLLVPMLWQEWKFRREGSRTTAAAGARWGWLWAGLIPGGLGLFMLWCQRLFGDPLAFVARQSRWRGDMSGPWRGIVRWWESGPTAHGTHGSTLELVLALLMVVLLVALLPRLRVAYSLFAAPVILFPLCATVWSFGRIATAAFPVYMILGVRWAEGRRALPVALAFCGGTVGAFLMALFASWWWAG